MRRFKVGLKLGCYLTVFLFQVGCAGMGMVKFDKSVKTPIKTIALLRVDEPEPKEIQVNAPPTILGRVGGLINYSNNSESYSNTFRDAINYHFIQFGPAMAESLRQELSKKGYDVIYMEDKSLMMGSSPRNGIVDVKDIKTNSDAILYVGIFNVGYSSFKAGYSFLSLFQKYTDFKPQLFIHVRLYDSYSKKIIYARHICMVEKTGATNAIHMLPDDKYKFKSFEQLIKNFEEAVQGIMYCQHRIAARIAEDLK